MPQNSIPQNSTYVHNPIEAFNTQQKCSSRVKENQRLLRSGMSDARKWTTDVGNADKADNRSCKGT